MICACDVGKANRIGRDMEFTPITTSSNVDGIHHDPETKTLHVRFKGGSVYRYVGVGADEHAALMGADSIGGRLNSHIKGKYPHSKV
jgi:hypothetical protein